MKFLYALVFVLTLGVLTVPMLSAQEDTFPSNYSVPEEAEVRALIEMFRFYDGAAEQPLQRAPQLIQIVMEEFFPDDGIVGAFARARLRETEHEVFRLVFAEFVEGTGAEVPEDHYERIMLTDRLEPVTSEPTGMTEELNRQVSPDGRFEEGINLSSIGTVRPFDGRLRVVSLPNPWQDWTQAPPADDPMPPEESLVLGLGGPSHSMNMSFRRWDDVSDAGFETLQGLTEERLRGAHPDNPAFLVREVSDQGIFAASGASQAVQLLARSGGSQMPEQMNATSLLYDAESGQAWAVSYFLNMSPLNVNYPLLDEIFLQIAQLSSLVYLQTE